MDMIFMSKDILQCVKKCQILYQFQKQQAELEKNYNGEKQNDLNTKWEVK